MFILQHHLQHLLVGFGISSNLVPHIGHWRSNNPMGEISDEAKSFEDKCTFLTLFHFLSDYFDIDSYDFDCDTLRKRQ